MRIVSGRFGSPSFLSGPRGLAVAGAAGFLLVPVLASVAGASGAELGVWRFLLISIALYSFAYGLRGGLAAGGTAVVLSLVWHFATPFDSISGVAVLLRSLNYVLAGAIVGGLVDSRARAVGALARHVELSSDVIVSGSEGNLDGVNPAFTRILGHAVGDVVGRPYLDFVHPEDWEKSRAVEVELEAGRRADRDVREPLPPS